MKISPVEVTLFVNTEFKKNIIVAYELFCGEYWKPILVKNEIFK